MTDKVLIDRSVVEKALTTLEGWGNYDKWVWPESALFTAKKNTAEMITALRAALEQPQVEQEPALWIRRETLEQVQRVPPNEEEPKNGVAGGQRLLMNVVLSAIPHSYYGQVPLYTKLDSEHNHA